MSSASQAAQDVAAGVVKVRCLDFATTATRADKRCKIYARSRVFATKKLRANADEDVEGRRTY